LRELISMWKHTKMVVLVALTAAVYAAVLIPFKGIPIIPGYTELRPANAIPVVCSLLFGPAAAWGSAFGNLIADFFGTLGLGSIFGFIGNFLYGYIPYRVWREVSRGEIDLKERRSFLGHMWRYLAAVFLASTACAAIIGWGVDLLGLVPFAALGNIIMLNNFIVAAVLGPILLVAIYPRAKRWGLLYEEIVEAEDLSPPRLKVVGQLLLWLGTVGTMVLGNIISVGLYDAVPFKFAAGIRGGAALGLGLVPTIAIILIASALI